MTDLTPATGTRARCANCGEAAGPRFCPHCGQEVLAHHGPLLEVGREFLSDWLSLDSQLFRSLRALMRPARLSQLYLSGKRAPFLRPFRLYLVASLVLFSTALTLQAPDASEYEIFLGSQRVGSPAPVDPGKTVELQFGSRTGDVRKSLQLLDDGNLLEGLMLRMAGDRIARLQTLPEQQVVEMLFGGLRRMLPPMLILFVPLLALGLKLLYIRRRALHHLYLDHLVFAIHFQAALFFALSAAWLVSWIARFGLIGNIVVFVLPLAGLAFVYLPLAVRRFYGQSRLVTGLKTVAVLWVYSQLLGLIVAFSSLVGIWDV
jgi:hypothetical protein